MIQLTRLNRQPLWVNSDLLKFVEATPDSVITLVNGEKIVVLENVDVILQRLMDFRRALLEGLMLCAPPSREAMAHFHERVQSGPQDQRHDPAQDNEDG